MVAFPLVPSQPKGQPSPEELMRMYAQRLETLVRLEAQVVDLEASLAEFHALFSARCGRLSAELADLEVEISRLLLERRPDDKLLQERLRRAEETAARRQGLAEDTSGEVASSPVQRSPEAQAVYHAIARRIHPDLARDPAEAQARHDLMIHANWLYAQGDLQGLHVMLSDCLRGTSQVTDARDLAGYFAEKIATMNRSISVLTARLRELQQSDDAVLRDEMFGGSSGVGYDGEASQEKRDPFDRLVKELSGRINYTRQRVEQLRRPGGTR